MVSSIRRRPLALPVTLLLVAALASESFSFVSGVGPTARISNCQAARAAVKRGDDRYGGEEDMSITGMTFKKKKLKEWTPPFPKYAVFGALAIGFLGLIGGGPQLGFIFFVSGAGFGTLFEPYRDESTGRIYGWGIEDDEDDDE
mmetsp:Transcript_15423/g.27006  ORF Transcript_15423/g.27006 Transcript_15423/m.27006 type:complete len:144 (+) Transcript_15423:73-504(+)